MSDGNKSRAAELLQIKRSTLGDRINRCGLGRADTIGAHEDQCVTEPHNPLTLEVIMSNVVEGLFLLAFWAPPLAVLAGALSLFITVPSAHGSSAPAHARPLTH